MERRPGGSCRLRGIPDSPPLTGRRREQDLLRAALDRVQTGAGAAIALEGEAGIGKTRLLHQVLSEASDRGWCTLSGRAEELERHRPLHALAGMVAGVPAGHRPDPARGTEHALVDTFVDGVSSLAARGPVVLAVDDLNWCDGASLRALAAVARRTAADPVLLLTASRPLPRSRPLERLGEVLLAVGGIPVHLDALPAEDVDGLTAHLTGAPPGPVLRACVRKAGGNPFYVVETVRALVEDRALEVRAGRSECRDQLLPSSVRRLVLHRLTALPTDVQEVLRLAAVLGGSFSVADLAAFTGRDAVALAGPLRTAAEAGFLTDGDRAPGLPGALSFRHDLIREALYTDLPAAVRAGLHQRAGAALAAAAAPAARVAQQLALGAYAGEASADRAVDWLRRAAADPAAPASTTAALLERALALTARTGPTRDAVAAELLPSLLATGRAGQAARLAADLLPRLVGPDQETAVRGMLAAARQAQGDVAGALHELDQLAGLPAAGPAATQVLAFSAALRLYTGDAAGADRDAGRAAEAAEASQDAQTWCAVWATRALAAAARGDVPGGLALAGQAAARAARDPWLQFANDPRTSLGVVLANADRLADAEAAFHSALRHSDATDGPAPSFHWGLVGVHYLAGRLDDVQVEAQTGLVLAAEGGDTWGAAVGSALRARCRLYADDLPGAAAELDAARGVRSGPPTYADDWLVWVRALLADAAGRPQDAAARAAEAWWTLPGLHYLYGWRLMAGDIVRLTRVADRSTAESVVADASRGADLAGPDVPGARAVALRCQGILTGDPDVLLQALAASRRAGRPLDVAATAEDTARALVALGRPAEAVPVLQEALGLYERCGAPRAAARALAGLRELGVRRRARTPTRTADTGWSALTPTETRVAALLAEGLTNRQIGERLYISRRTVETHLVHVFGKLGVPTRSAAAAVAAQQQAVPSPARR
ncbi:ATP-binding protein [Modestobacter lapidis]|nr:AAA family ATPase [Modestobacter lapidis]